MTIHSCSFVLLFVSFRSFISFVGNERTENVFHKSFLCLTTFELIGTFDQKSHDHFMTVFDCNNALVKLITKLKPVQLSRDTLYSIILKNLKLGKVVAPWVPHKLTDEDQRKRVEGCRKRFKLVREGRWRLCVVVTGNESWSFD